MKKPKNDKCINCAERRVGCHSPGACAENDKFVEELAAWKAIVGPIIQAERDLVNMKEERRTKILHANKMKGRTSRRRK